MLARLAARLRARSGGMDSGDGEDEGGPIVIDENCLVSANLLRLAYGANMLPGHVRAILARHEILGGVDPRTLS